MRKYVIIALFLAIIPVAAPAQTKQEIKAQKRAERAETRRILDSIYNAEDEARIKAYEEKERRKNANTLIVTTTYASQGEAYNTLINALLDSGYLIAEKDKEFYTIKTEIKDAGLARYDLAFRVKAQDGKIMVEISGRVHMTFAMYGIVNTFVEPITNKGADGSANKVGFSEMERYSNILPHTNVDYIIR